MTDAHGFVISTDAKHLSDFQFLREGTIREESKTLAHPSTWEVFCHGSSRLLCFEHLDSIYVASSVEALISGTIVTSTISLCMVATISSRPW